MKIKKLPLILVISLIFFSFFAKSAEAKVLPQAQKASPKAVVKQQGSTIGIFPRLRGDRRALLVNFTNLQNAAAVSYSLTYKTSTQDEGAMGALTLGGSSTSMQELLFGTCSKNVCRYHTGINNARLEVSYTSKSGKKYLRKYRIKV